MVWSACACLWQKAVQCWRNGHERNAMSPITSARRGTKASLGYDHFLSKRTDVYAAYSYDKLSRFDSANTFALGIRHTF
jgi:predicted porin